MFTDLTTIEQYTNRVFLIKMLLNNRIVNYMFAPHYRSLLYNSIRLSIKKHLTKTISLT